MRLVHDSEKRYHDCEHNTYIAIDDNGKMLGRICTRKVSWFGVEFCHLFVKEDYRRQGVATFLNNELIKLYNQSVLLATVRCENNPSIQMMKSLGFTEALRFGSKISGMLVTLFVRGGDRELHYKA